MAACSFTTLAADTLLSPRATENQINKTAIPAKASAAVPATGTTSSVWLSPRAAGNQFRLVPGNDSAANARMACDKMMTTSPKVVAECSSHATMLGCATAAR